MCKWKISLTQMFLHGMQGRLIRFCRPFMPGVEKHTDSLTEIAVKTHFASQGFIDSGYITCRIFITLPFQYAYGFIQDFTNFPACTVHASDSFHGICTIKEYSSAKRIKLTGGNAVSCIKNFLFPFMKDLHSQWIGPATITPPLY